MASISFKLRIIKSRNRKLIRYVRFSREIKHTKCEPFAQMLQARRAFIVVLKSERSIALWGGLLFLTISSLDSKESEHSGLSFTFGETW